MKKRLTSLSGLGNNAAMTMTENIYEAKTHFSHLIERAMAGDEVIICW